MPFGEIACDVRDAPAGTGIDVCIRPEDVVLEAPGAAATAANSFAGTVTRREYLGEHISLSVDVGGAAILVRAARVHPAEPGDRMTVTLPAPALYSIVRPTGDDLESDASAGLPSEAPTR